MRIHYTNRAVRHLDEIYALAVERYGAGHAGALFKHLGSILDDIARFPNSGRQGRIAGTREFVTPHFPFVIAYHVTDDAVQVLAIIHTARAWSDKF